MWYFETRVLYTKFNTKSGMWIALIDNGLQTPLQKFLFPFCFYKVVLTVFCEWILLSGIYRCDTFMTSQLYLGLGKKDSMLILTALTFINTYVVLSYLLALFYIHLLFYWIECNIFQGKSLSLNPQSHFAGFYLLLIKLDFKLKDLKRKYQFLQLHVGRRMYFFIYIHPWPSWTQNSRFLISRFLISEPKE